jgi:hypothetical protein
MAIEAESFVGDASERLASFKKVAAGRRSRFTEKKSLRGVFGENARAAAEFSVCPHRSLPNQPVQTTRLRGAVFLTRLLRSTSTVARSAETALTSARLTFNVRRKISGD